MDESVAMNFAARGETDILNQVVLRIRMENKHGKYYICLDRKEYTVYLDEKEVLLQAGLKAELVSFEVTDDDITIFNLYISDSSVKRE